MESIHIIFICKIYYFILPFLSYLMLLSIHVHPKLQVSSESGWSPNPELLARRQYVKTKWGWFPKEDAFGGGEFMELTLCHHLCGSFFLFYL